jgi:hypothetical protein
VKWTDFVSFFLTKLKRSCRGLSLKTSLKRGREQAIRPIESSTGEIYVLHARLTCVSLGRIAEGKEEGERVFYKKISNINI